MSGKSRLAVHGIIPRTSTNGPGIRFGIWVQGCKRHCPGCFNPWMIPQLPADAGEFQPPSSPGWITVEKLTDMVSEEMQMAGCRRQAELVGDRHNLEGVTFSGGEPFDQPGPLHELLKKIRAMGLSVLIFTGYKLAELLDRPETRIFFEPEPMVDILVDGPYERDRPVEGELRGSANQNIRLITDKYSEMDLVPPGALECVIMPDGSMSVTGFTRGPFETKNI